MPDGGIPAEDRRAGIDGRVILDSGMAFVARQRFFHAEGAQGDALVDLDVVADDGRFSDDDSGTVIDEKLVADGRAGMDVYASLVVNVLAHDARQQWDIALV